jgi:hypothetical protein
MLDIYRLTMYSGSMNGSLMETTSRSSRVNEARKTKRPIRPKPLIPILTTILLTSNEYIRVRKYVSLSLRKISKSEKFNKKEVKKQEESDGYSSNRCKFIGDEMVRCVLSSGYLHSFIMTYGVGYSLLWGGECLGLSLSHSSSFSQCLLLVWVWYQHVVFEIV